MGAQEDERLITTTLASLVLAATAAAAQPTGADLPAIAACLSAGPLKGVETQRRTGTAATRTVNIPGEPERRVSVVDGLRVLLATAPGQLFVNLKLERSAPDQAEQDRAAIRQQMRNLARAAPTGSPPLRELSDGGIETLGLNQPSLDSAGTLGFYTLFVPQADLVVTLYLLNQVPAQRAFASYADYERLRDQALEQVRACLPKAAP